ncbi:MAG: ChaB family protein [Candidatus Hodarchaeota archaeon]
MPYSKKSDLPDWVQKMPSGAQSIWKSTFNKAYKKHDEEKAFKIAVSAVKSKYKKVGDKWVKKKAKEASRATEDKVRQLANITVANLKEATFDDEKQTVTIPFLRECTSKNGYKYTAEIVEAFLPYLQRKRKMFANHKSGDRSINEWAATIKETWFEDNQAFLECGFNSPYKWLYETAKEHPEEVAVSIDALAYVNIVKEGDRDVFQITEWIKAKSVDFVTDNSVPGAHVTKVNEMLNDYRILEVVSDSLQYRLDKIKDDRDEWNLRYDITSALGDFIGDLMQSDPDDDDVKSSIRSFCDDLSEKLKEIVGKYRNLWMGDSDGESNNEESNDTSNIIEEEVMYKTLIELKEGDQNLYDDLVKEVRQLIEKEGELDKLRSQITTLTEQVETLKKEKIDLQGRVDIFEAEEKSKKLEAYLDEKVEEMELKEIVSNEWKKLVLESAGTVEKIDLFVGEQAKMKSSKVTGIIEEPIEPVASRNEKVDFDFIK